jgi:hypothetical protein
MDFPLIIVSTILILYFGLMFFTIYKIYTNKKLKNRDRSNLIFLQLYLPILGSLYYFFWLDRRSKNSIIIDKI